ncbi:MAG: divalent cation tolerance protein CutA [Candidatus Woesearchaeota archaeon]
MSQVIWIIVNCNSIEEATSIGNEMLKKRIIGCFDVYPRHLAAYFWPPKSEKIETAKGAMLILETFDDNYDSISKEVKNLHSDDLPFVGYTEMKGISEEYLNWMNGELIKK